MAARKTSKKSTKKTSKKINNSASKHRTISFLVGIITVALIALAIFGIAQGKNYKTVLGTHTEIENQH